LPIVFFPTDTIHIWFQVFIAHPLNLGVSLHISILNEGNLNMNATGIASNMKIALRQKIRPLKYELKTRPAPGYIHANTTIFNLNDVRNASYIIFGKRSSGEFNLTQIY